MCFFSKLLVPPCAFGHGMTRGDIKKPRFADKNQTKINVAAQGEEKRRPSSDRPLGKLWLKQSGNGQTDVPWPLSCSKNKSVCLRHGVDLFGRNVRKQLKCVFLSVCRAPLRLLETVVSNSLIFLTSHHLLWQTRFLFRIVLGLFISGPVSSPLTTSLSSALVCFFYPLQTFVLNIIQRGLPFQSDSFPKSFLFKFPSSVIS